MSPTFFYKTDISFWAARGRAGYLPENSTYKILFRKTVSINYWNLIKIVSAVLDKVGILYLGSLSVSCCRSYNVRIHWVPIYYG
jgi:hypothetical protein